MPDATEKDLVAEAFGPVKEAAERALSSLTTPAQRDELLSKLADWADGEALRQW